MVVMLQDAITQTCGGLCGNGLTGKMMRSQQPWVLSIHCVHCKLNNHLYKKVTRGTVKLCFLKEEWEDFVKVWRLLSSSEL